jgi:transposase
LKKITPSEVCIRETFQRFCETVTAEDRECSGRPSKITEEKVDDVHDVCENGVATTSLFPRTILHRTMTEYLPMKLYNV